MSWYNIYCDDEDDESYYLYHVWINSSEGQRELAKQKASEEWLKFELDPKSITEDTRADKRDDRRNRIKVWHRGCGASPVSRYLENRNFSKNKTNKGQKRNSFCNEMREIAV